MFKLPPPPTSLVKKLIHRFLAALLPLSMLVCSTAFSQIAPTASGDVLTYDFFTAKQGFLQSEVTFQQSKEPRILRLNIESSNERNYTFLSGKPFATYDKLFTRTSASGKAISPTDYFEILPKKEGDVEWEFNRSGYDSFCRNWTGKHFSKIKDGQDFLISVDGKDRNIKALMVEITGEVLQGNTDCGIVTIKRFHYYSPEFNELVAEQVVNLANKTTIINGYKWVLKSITTKAGQAAK